MKKLFYAVAVAVLVVVACLDQRSLKLDFANRKLARWQSAAANRAGVRERNDSALPVFARELAPLNSSETGSSPRTRSDDELQLAVESIAVADIPAALAALATKSGADAVEMRTLLVRRWAENDPAAAAKWATQLPAGELRPTALEHVATVWGELDLAAATTWLRDLPEGEEKQMATTSIAYEAARSNPVLALELACQLPPALGRDELLVFAVSQWGAENFPAAVEWTGRIADAGLREEMLSAIAVAAASADAPAAATMVASALAPGAAQARAAVAITQRWTQTAPEEAAAWVAQFPDVPLRAVAVENLVGLWGRNDSQAVASWVNDLPAGSLRDQALRVYAANVSQFQCASATQ